MISDWWIQRTEMWQRASSCNNQEFWLILCDLHFSAVLIFHASVLHRHYSDIIVVLLNSFLALPSVYPSPCLPPRLNVVFCFSFNCFFSPHAQCVLWPRDQENSLWQKKSINTNILKHHASLWHLEITKTDFSLGTAVGLNLFG